MNNTIPTFACVLKSGGDYKPEHVRVLAKQVETHTTVSYRFVCYSDIDTIPGVETIKLEGEFEGWWAVPEVFRNQGPTIITGIDTVIYQNIDALFKIAINSSSEDFWMIRAFANPNKTASGIMIYNGDWSWLWEEYKTANASKSFRGEQDYTISKLKERNITPKIIQDAFQGIYSWKKHCRAYGIPSDCRVILFHGKPRPHEVPELWKSLEMGIYTNRGKVERVLNGGTIFILGGGPSLTDSIVPELKNKTILGINQAYQLGDWVDFCYSGDKRWFEWNKQKIKNYKGTLYTSYPKFDLISYDNIINLGRISSYGISNKSRYSIAWNGNSGASAINIAYWLGAKRIVLLGFDMRRIGNSFNWHKQYPRINRRNNNRYPNPYIKFLKCFRQIAIDAKRLGIEIINATPNSAIQVFPKTKLKELL